MKNSNFNEVLAEALAKFNKCTNGDKIRAMTDEELAWMLGGLVSCNHCKLFHGIDNCPASDKFCSEVWEGWLKQEATE